jgi:progressive ankylosis protein
MVLLPGLEVLISFQRAVLVDARKTSFITNATIIEVAGIIITLFIGIRTFNSIGAVIASLAFVIGRLGANIYLFYPFFKITKSYHKNSS